ncbi:dorsal-ventral patterning protein Sog-like [Amphibalanus amphitrite]|uniref:dorsal-ventral patterning protein Sog-like n=1 Tax=Amphibalanus amphitrite TaxID=1232801 RepID=UPI001C922C07|nr:dorsal-ventral patterning protein Sog-like [Amphibalanus amphitrite]
MRLPLLFLLAVAACVAVSEAKPRRRPKPPIKGDDYSRPGRRRHRKSSVCHFGKQTYELEAMWNPDLGSPFGVMYCVQCECVPIQRKRRVVGRVKCRNIKRDCPKPNCKNPVMPVGECCKTCMDDASRARSRIDMVEEDDEPNGKEFAVLMTGLSSYNSTGSPSSITNALATGRFRLARRQLTYSFYYERMPRRPDRIVFFDEKVRIVEELTTSATEYETESQKVCGVWKKVPRRYRRKLKGGQLHVGLAYGEPEEEGVEQLDLAVSGKILRYRGLQTEKFSALLAPPEDQPGASSGAGGTAIVSLASQTGSFHITLVTHGLWGPEETGDGPLVVQMSARNSGKMSMDRQIDANKVTEDETIIEAKTSLLPEEMRRLARAQLHLKVFSRTHPDRQLEGIIMPRIGCNVFSALLSGVKSNDKTPPATTASGLATLRLWNDGRLDYAIRLIDVRSTVLRISIETDLRRRAGGGARPAYEVDDVLPQYLNGWANGTLRRMVARDVEALLDEDLYINVGTEQYRSELRGRVTQLTVSEARQSDAPIMLTSRNSSSAGVAWMAVDDDCALHYKVQVADRTPGNRRIELVEFPGRKRRQRVLAEFGGSRAENRINNLPKTTMMRMEKGQTVVKVVPLNGDDEMSSEHAKVFVPKSCLPTRRIRLDNYHMDGDDGLENEIQRSYDCEYENQIYEEGTQWEASHESCKICSCTHGKVSCERILCPTLTCRNQHTPNGSCCPVCDGDEPEEAEVANDPTEGCLLANRFRAVGSIWHPYVPPFGFNKCVTCTCQLGSAPGDYQVSCSKPPCPDLDCPGREYMPSGACCRECRPVAKIEPRILASTYRGAMGDEAHEMSQEEILQAGGCRKGTMVYRNGDTWHPRIATIGLMPCITCRCRDGSKMCGRTRCPELNCRNTKEVPGQCCPVCVDHNKPTEKKATRRRRSQV